MKKQEKKSKNKKRLKLLEHYPTINPIKIKKKKFFHDIYKNIAKGKRKNSSDACECVSMRARRPEKVELLSRRRRRRPSSHPLTTIINFQNPTLFTLKAIKFIVKPN